MIKIPAELAVRQELQAGGFVSIHLGALLYCFRACY